MAHRPDSLLDRYRRGTPDDWLERNIYSVYCNWGPTLMAVTDLALFGVAGMAIWAVQMMWIPFWAAGVVNGVGHWFGYRNFETADKSTNFAPWGFWVGGEKLHNNHHAFPSSATFAIRPFEFDIGWLVICGLVEMRLAKVLRSAPRDALQPLFPGSDVDVLALVHKHRVRLMTAFFSDVIVPTFHDNADTSAEPFKGPSYRVRRGLANGGRWLSERERGFLDAWIMTRPALLTVCQFRYRLEALTMRRQAAALVDDIQQWIHDAEASGIEALQAFAARLGGHHG